MPSFDDDLSALKNNNTSLLRHKILLLSFLCFTAGYYTLYYQLD